MNFLAHALLSGDDEMVLTGNMVADHVRGSQLDLLPEAMRLGVQLHRRIDAFTDSHPVVKHTSLLLIPDFGKYAPVVLDIYFDHFLAIGWARHGKGDLTVFAQRVYRTLLFNYHLLPARSRRILPWMIAQNWLAGYANLRDLQRVFYGMNRRASFQSGMDNAVQVLIENYSRVETAFNDFWPELSLDTMTFMSKLAR
ncbi:MAG TPA: ACP phosphodiesterase [Bacteroidales bacterium]|nr:ACP phosphodiesterase [Bacteroidales bacterium]